MLEIFFILLLSHLIADFYLQCDSFCRAKDEKGFRSWQVYVHALIVWGCAWIMLPHITFWYGALILGVFHFLMDGIKHYIRKCKWVFFVDQLFHMAMITMVAYLYQDQSTEMLACWNWNIKYVVYALGFLLICKPTNVLIQNIFRIFDLQLSEAAQKESPSLLQAGHVIGIAERIMAFLFVLVNQYEALGFLIAAKSILRFRDADTARTEYVLVGTLLSFLIAVLTALGIEGLI